MSYFNYVWKTTKQMASWKLVKICNKKVKYKVDAELCTGQYTWLPFWRTRAQIPTQTWIIIFSSFFFLLFTGFHKKLGAEDSCINLFSKLRTTSTSTAGVATLFVQRVEKMPPSAWWAQKYVKKSLAGKI